MNRGLSVLVTLLAAASFGVAGQTLSVLHIKVVLLNADRNPTPLAHHALLISDNPATAPPRRVVTALDGTADVRLRPGNYTVESDQPVIFQGNAYEWIRNVDIIAGRDAVLELTAENAEVKAADAAAADTRMDEDPSAVIAEWQHSIVDVWTPTARGSAFVIGADGLVATSQRVVGTATSIEVQFTPGLKVAANILVADPVRDVAVLRIDPMTAASVRPVPLGCEEPAKPGVVDGQKIFAIDGPLGKERGTTSGIVRHVSQHDIESDLMLARDAAGGPVFTARGLVGLASIREESGRRHSSSRVVPTADLCDIVATAQKKMTGAAPPNGTHLPVEPTQPFPRDALKDAVKSRAGSLNPYQMSSADFDVAFVTPVMTYAAQYRSEPVTRDPAKGARPSLQQVFDQSMMDFSNWSEYVADVPPVVLVRVTPKQVEGFWTKVARGAAQTQGMALPPIKHFKSGFSRLRAFCGDTEITPIHPFKLERRVSETDAIYEGLYVFDPDAIAPSCETVKLVLYSEKEPQKGDALVVDPHVVQQIWRDFEPYRALR